MNEVEFIRRDNEYRWDEPPKYPAWIVRRSSNNEYERMIVVWKWCEATFGKMESNMSTWSVNFTNSDNDDEVTFTFYDKNMATLFALKWA